MDQFFQRLSIFLKGGQTIVVDFKAAEPSKLNPQIESFIQAMGDPEKKDKNFLFQGARVVLVRLPDVSGIDVVSLVLKAGETEKKEVEEAK
jgi:hypothetical protein